MKPGQVFEWWGTRWKCQKIEPDSKGRNWVVASAVNGDSEAHILLSKFVKEKPKQGELM